MQFKDVVGQDNLKDELISLALENRVPHSILFAGSEGFGTLPLALAFIQYLFCEDKGANDSCGQCKSCTKQKKLSHPDVHISFPVLGSDKLSAEFMNPWRELIFNNPYTELWDWIEKIGEGNKQMNINNRECLEQIRILGLKSFESDKKAWLIWMPEFLGNLGNKLLKLLEEPPENTFIILVSVKPENLLGTILSRCQTFRINPINQETLQNIFIQDGLTLDKAREVSLIAGGNINIANSILSNRDHSYRDLFISWLRQCYTFDPVKIVEETEKIARLNREQLKHLISYGLHYLRKCLHVYSGMEIENIDIEESRSVRGMSKLLDLEKIIEIRKILESMIHAIERNASPKILFMGESITIHRILRRVVKKEMII